MSTMSYSSMTNKLKNGINSIHTRWLLLNTKFNGEVF